MKKSMKRSTWAWLNISALLITIVVNVLANLLPFNGLTTAEVSDLYPNLFTPAGVTFSIWSVIYLLLGGFVIYQWKVFVRNETYTAAQFTELSLWFMLSCFLNASWLFAWHYLFTGLSVFIMMLLLFSLIRIFLFLDKIERNYLLEKTFIHLPFTFYLAWICVATIANITAFFVSLPGNDEIISSEVWTVAMMVLTTVLATVITLKYNVAGFAAVIFWALLGIFIRWSGQYHFISYTAAGLMVVLASLMLYMLITKREKLFL